MTMPVIFVRLPEAAGTSVFFTSTTTPLSWPCSLFQVKKVVGQPLTGKVVKNPKLKMQEMENLNTALRYVV